MHCARPALIAPVLFGLLPCIGCYGPYQSPYGPYGSPYGGYPGVGGPPIQTLQPGPTYAPSGVTPQGSGSFSQPTPVDPTGGNTPYFGNGSSTPNHDGGVPTYDDPGAIQFQPPVSPGSTADRDVFEHGSVEGVSAQIAGAARVDLQAAQFVAPVPMSSDVPQQVVPSVLEVPYAYDENYHWLRGVLRFDQTGGTWTITYSDDPATSDAHAGRLIVADSPLLAPLKPHAVVLLQGGIDTALSTSAGRAIYRVDAVETVDLPSP